MAELTAYWPSLLFAAAGYVFALLQQWYTHRHEDRTFTRDKRFSTYAEYLSRFEKSQQSYYAYLKKEDILEGAHMAIDAAVATPGDLSAYKSLAKKLFDGVVLWNTENSKLSDQLGNLLLVASPALLVLLNEIKDVLQEIISLNLSIGATALLPNLNLLGSEMSTQYAQAINRYGKVLEQIIHQMRVDIGIEE